MAPDEMSDDALDMGGTDLSNSITALHLVKEEKRAKKARGIKDRHNIDLLDPCLSLYRCWIFDHAEGFVKMTHILSYNPIGHLTKHNPTIRRNLRLDHRVIHKHFLTSFYCIVLMQRIRTAQRRKRAASNSDPQ